MIAHNYRASPQRVEEAKMSSINIIILPEVKQPLELPIIMEDPNVAGAVAKLTSPCEPGETFQIYEQCCVGHRMLAWHPNPCI